MRTLPSVRARSTEGCRLMVGMGDTARVFRLGNLWERLSLTAETENGVISVRLTALDGGGAELTQAMLESGGHVTDWVPAPEDTGEAIAALVDEMRRAVRIDREGLHVGDSETDGEVCIDSDSVSIVLNGRRYSAFAADHVRFGEYQLRRSRDGGLVFRVRE